MARKSRRLDSDMTQGSIWRQLIEFSLPMMIGLIFQQLYNTVDTIVVGQFVGKEALAAVGTTSSIINMLVGLRVSPDVEREGLDVNEHGERAYHS